MIFGYLNLLYTRGIFLEERDWCFCRSCKHPSKAKCWQLCNVSVNKSKWLWPLFVRRTPQEISWKYICPYKIKNFVDLIKVRISICQINPTDWILQILNIFLHDIHLFKHSGDFIKFVESTFLVLFSYIKDF